MKKKIFIFIILIVAVISEMSAQIYGYKKVTISNFSFEIPKDWKVSECTKEIPILISEFSEEAGDFYTNGSITEMVLKEDMPANEYKRLNTLYLKANMDGFKIIEERDNYQIYEYIRNGNKVIIIQYFIVKNKKGYVVGYGGCSPEKFYKDLPTYKYIYSTLIIR